MKDLFAGFLTAVIGWAVGWVAVGLALRATWWLFMLGWGVI